MDFFTNIFRENGCVWRGFWTSFGLRVFPVGPPDHPNDLLGNKQILRIGFWVDLLLEKKQREKRIPPKKMGIYFFKMMKLKNGERIDETKIPFPFRIFDDPFLEVQIQPFINEMVVSIG